MGTVMSTSDAADASRDFEVYVPSSSPLDHACTWVSDSTKWPLRFLIAAVICPVIVAFGGEVEFFFQWSLLGDNGMSGDSMAFLALAPVLAIVMVFVSRAVNSLVGQAALCAGAGVMVLAPCAYYMHWVFAAFCLGLVCIAVGNRVGKQFTHVRMPRVLAGVGGVTLVTLYCLPVAGEGTPPLISMLFEGGLWSEGIVLVPVLFGIFIYGLLGLGLAFPHQKRDVCAAGASLVARGVLAWTPIAVLAAGQELLGFFGGGMMGAGGITMMTLAFKAFGIGYAALIFTALGASAWCTGWLWGRLGSEVGGDGFDDDGATAPVEPEPELVEV